MMMTTTIEGVTPQHIIERVSTVLEGIALDPCGHWAIDTGADLFFGPQRNGTLVDAFEQDWTARSVWLSPPAQSLSNTPITRKRNGKPKPGAVHRRPGDWYSKLLAEYLQGNVRSAIAWIPNLANFGGYSYLMAFPVAIQFKAIAKEVILPDGERGNPRDAHYGAFVLLPAPCCGQVELFRKTFADIARLYLPSN